MWVLLQTLFQTRLLQKLSTDVFVHLLRFPQCEEKASAHLHPRYGCFSIAIKTISGHFRSNSLKGGGGTLSDKMMRSREMSTPILRMRGMPQSVKSSDLVLDPLPPHPVNDICFPPSQFLATALNGLGKSVQTVVCTKASSISRSSVPKWLNGIICYRLNAIELWDSRKYGRRIEALSGR